MDYTIFSQAESACGKKPQALSAFLLSFYIKQEFFCKID
jgi:hypothetical protein